MALKPNDSFDIYSEGWMYDGETADIDTDIPFSVGRCLNL